MKLQYQRLQSAKKRISPRKRELTAKEIMKDLELIGLEVSPENLARFMRSFRGN
jgi:hypothetical protein